MDGLTDLEKEDGEGETLKLESSEAIEQRRRVAEAWAGARPVGAMAKGEGDDSKLSFFLRRRLFRSPAHLGSAARVRGYHIMGGLGVDGTEAEANVRSLALVPGDGSFLPVRQDLRPMAHHAGGGEALGPIEPVAVDHGILAGRLLSLGGNAR